MKEVKLKDISGLMGDKKHRSPYSGTTNQHFECIGYNSALDILGEKKVGLDVVKLAEILVNLYGDQIATRSCKRVAKELSDRANEIIVAIKKEK